MQVDAIVGVVGGTDAGVEALEVGVERDDVAGSVDDAVKGALRV